MKKMLKKNLKINYKIKQFNKYILKHYYIMFKKKYSLTKYFGKSKRRRTFRKRHNLRKKYNKSKKNMRGG
jgi:hypothetical protein